MVLQPSSSAPSTTCHTQNNNKSRGTGRGSNILDSWNECVEFRWKYFVYKIMIVTVTVIVIVTVTVTVTVISFS